MKNPFRILIVEDELLIAEMLREMLLELGYQVAGVAKDYPSAVPYLAHRNDIDLCFIDINLESGQSGFDLAKTIRENYFVPFVFLTSYSDRKTVTDAAAFGPEAYLVKPFSATDLLTTPPTRWRSSPRAWDTRRRQRSAVRSRTATACRRPAIDETVGEAPEVRPLRDVRAGSVAPAPRCRRRR